MIFTYWAFMGLFYLGILTVQDYRNMRMVDDRYNYLMLGASISLVSHTNNSFWYLLGLTAILFILYGYLRKLKPLGEADINTISWIFLGYGIIRAANLGVFVAIFTAFTLLFYVLKYIICRIAGQPFSQPTAFYGVIFLSFLASVLLNGYL
jgi:hypothetical protein